ncbi:MAG: replicative DNA helicase [Lachnospiraceae bacterium]|nr:replicative DNA helicase [Lachnospiraceae bacterium]
MDEGLIKRIPPHSIEAEQSVIGSMLYSQDAISVVSEILQPEDFYQQQYGVIYSAILELYTSSRPTDVVTLQNTLKQKDVPPEVYGLDFLKELLNSVFTAANAKAYANIVKEKALLRRMIRTMEDLADRAYLGKDETEVLLEETEKSVFDLLEKRSSGGYEPIADIMMRVLEQIEAASKDPGHIRGIPSGYADLDEKTSGFQNSDLILIAGRPSMGKTAFALNLADHFSIGKDYTTVYFEMEMSREQLVNRLLAMESRVDMQKIRNGNLSAAELDGIVGGSAMIAHSKLIIDDTPGLTVAELRSRCRRYKLEHGIDVIIIDYLQLMSGSGRGGESRQQEVSEISRSLKALARELNVPVIALSQLSRAPEQRTEHRPMLADLRESGAIEQDADIVMFLYRDEVYNQDTEDKGITELIIAKQRNGPIGTVLLGWQNDQTRFVNLIRRNDRMA